MCCTFPADVGLMFAVQQHSLQLANTEEEPPPWITADWRKAVGSRQFGLESLKNMTKDPLLFGTADAKIKKKQRNLSMVGYTGEAKVEEGSNCQKDKLTSQRPDLI